MWVLFTRFGAWLLGGLVALVPTIAGQGLIALGIGVATFTGVDASLAFLKSMALSYFALIPPHILAVIALMKVGVCISMVASALSVRLVMQGMTSGVIKQWVKR